MIQQISTRMFMSPILTIMSQFSHKLSIIGMRQRTMSEIVT